MSNPINSLVMRHTVVGVWHGDALFWKFELGKFSHEISDRDLRVWLRTQSGLDYHSLPHDGIIRKRHSDVYINKELLCA